MIIQSYTEIVVDRVSKKHRRMWTFAYFEQIVSVVWLRLFSLTFKNSKYHILGALVCAARAASISVFSLLKQN